MVVERSFSVYGRIMSKKRGALKLSSAIDIAFVQMNTRFSQGRSKEKLIFKDVAEGRRPSRKVLAQVQEVPRDWRHLQSITLI